MFAADESCGSSSVSSRSKRAAFPSISNVVLHLSEVISWCESKGKPQKEHSRVTYSNPDLKNDTGMSVVINGKRFHAMSAGEGKYEVTCSGKADELSAARFVADIGGGLTSDVEKASLGGYGGKNASDAAGWAANAICGGLELKLTFEMKGMTIQVFQTEAPFS